MSETEAPPVKAPEIPPPALASRPRRSAWPVVFAVGFLLLAGGEGYLWYNQQAHQADATQLAVLRTQMDDLRAEAAKAASAPDSITMQADLAQKFAALQAQVNAVQAQAAANHGAISALQANSTDLGKLTTRIELLNALGTARLALEAGQPLGTIPNAPPALAQFASTAPPTEASLRESFPEAARAATAASLSPDGKTGFWNTVRLRLESIITVSDGSHVLVGPSAAAALNQAQAALDAGDLAGAVAHVHTLSPPAQHAMGDWLPQAEALLAARTALLTMTQGA